MSCLRRNWSWIASGRRRVFGSQARIDEQEMFFVNGGVSLRGVWFLVAREYIGSSFLAEILVGIHVYVAVRIG